MHHTTLSLAILLTSTAAAQFGTAHVVTEGDLTNPTIVIPADINGDGYLDLVSMRKGSSSGEVTSVLWWASDGAGAFDEVQVLLGNLPNGFNIHGFADIDNDGLADLVAYPNTNNPAHWYRKLGGTVAAPRSFAEGEGP